MCAGEARAACARVLRELALRREACGRLPLPGGRTLLERIGARAMSRWRKFRREGEDRRIEGLMNSVGAESLVVRRDDFRGEFEVGARSAIFKMIRQGGYERDLLPYVHAILSAGDHVVDVGANVGLFTVLASRLVGPRGVVAAVEPDPSALKRLTMNIRRNGVENVRVMAAVLTDGKGVRAFNAVAGSPEYSSLGSVVHPEAPGAVDRIEVEGDTLDGAVEALGITPAMVKIDVEGAEGLVLAGGAAVLARDRPVVMSELDDRLLRSLSWDSSRVLALLAGHGYDVYDAYRGTALTGGGRPFVGEIVALPREHCRE